MLPARQYWPSLCLNSRSGPQGISTNIGLPKGGLLDYNCKSLLCSLFYEQTCSRFTRLSFVVTMPKIPLYGVLDHTFSESSRSKYIYTDIPKCLIHKYTNTNTQIHKYANTAYDKVPERPNMWYIFEKRIVQGYEKWYSHVSNTQIQKYKYKIHKYTNTA